MADNIKINCIHALKNDCTPWYELSYLNIVLKNSMESKDQKSESMSSDALSLLREPANKQLSCQ